jgi:AcrR family transcriptional regulator
MSHSDLDPIQNAVRTRKPRGQGASRRAEILAAATRIFLEEGVEHATMRRIAAVVGVSPTALYVYFPDKCAILGAIAEAWFADLLAALEASQRGHDSVDAAFRAGLRAYITFGMARPDAYRLTFAARPAQRDTPPPCDDIPEADLSFAVLQQGVDAMMAAGLFRPGNSETIAEAIWATLHGTTIVLLDHQWHLATTPEKLLDTTLDMIVGGFR